MCTSNQERIYILIEGRASPSQARKRRRGARTFLLSCQLFFAENVGGLKNGTSERQHLCGSEIPRVYYDNFTESQ